MNSIALLCAWRIEENKGAFYIPSMHYVYLEYACSHFKEVYLISPHHSVLENKFGFKLLDFQNLTLISLPPFTNYISSIKSFKSFVKAINQVKCKVDYFYSRVPDPFSWLPFFLTKKKNIMHFVGDSIDVIKGNVGWSLIKKTLYIAGYLPDYCLTLLAAYFSTVYTNGHHLADRLSKLGVKADPVISSTIRKTDIPLKLKPLRDDIVHILFVSYLRNAKGVDTMMELILLLSQSDIQYHFDIVGTGEMNNELINFIHEHKITKVKLHGHIDNRSDLYNLFRNADLFYFPSLSEGSPRVIIEAMSQGIPVIATPVGSLPHCFKDYENIRFVRFNSAKDAYEMISAYKENINLFDNQRKRAYEEVKEKYTVNNFMSKIFSNND